MSSSTWWEIHDPSKTSSPNGNEPPSTNAANSQGTSYLWPLVQYLEPGVVFVLGQEPVNDLALLFSDLRFEMLQRRSKSAPDVSGPKKVIA